MREWFKCKLIVPEIVLKLSYKNHGICVHLLRQPAYIWTSAAAKVSNIQARECLKLWDLNQLLTILSFMMWFLK